MLYLIHCLAQDRKARSIDLLPVTITKGSRQPSNGTALVITIEIELLKGRMRIAGADAALPGAAQGSR
jgi:hypothetical protein